MLDRTMQKTTSQTKNPNPEAMRYFSQLDPKQKDKLMQDVLRFHLRKHQDLDRTATLFKHFHDKMKGARVFKLKGSYYPIKFANLMNV